MFCICSETLGALRNLVCSSSGKFGERYKEVMKEAIKYRTNEKRYLNFPVSVNMPFNILYVVPLYMYIAK